MAEARIRVWDPLVRMVHWSVAVLVVIDLLNEAGANPWHRYLGYTAVALVAVRIAWGLADSGHARLAAMTRSASRALPYAKALLSGRAPATLGHTPLGALMAGALWSLVIFLAVTGWMLGLDAFWGEGWVQDLHRVAAYLLAALVVVHVGGALTMSAVHRENLFRAMITGGKRRR